MALTLHALPWSPWRRLAAAGLLIATDDRIALTGDGMRLASAVTLEVL